MKELTQKQIFYEIPELLDQLDALMEGYPLPSPVWKDIRKLMILSYDKGYSKGVSDTHMKMTENRLEQLLEEYNKEVFGDTSEFDSVEEDEEHKITLEFLIEFHRAFRNQNLHK